MINNKPGSQHAFLDLEPGAGGVVLISSQEVSKALVESLRRHHYLGPILVIEDAERPLGVIDDTYKCRRITVHRSEIYSITDLVLNLESPLGCVVGWHGIFLGTTIDAFRNRLLNVHAGDLPRYRGAGGGSWQVLNGANKVRADIQLMRTAIDRGPLIYGKTELLPPEPYPLDVKSAARIATAHALRWLGEAIATGRQVKLQEQDEGLATYFPRLDSARQAWLDFSWSPRDIERFIRAFSDPYPGAAFRYGELEFRVKRARLRDDDANLHPFCTGLIVNRDELEVHVAVNGGIICLSEITYSSGKKAPLDHFRVGHRLWTDPTDLRKAKGH